MRVYFRTVIISLVFALGVMGRVWFTAEAATNSGSLNVSLTIPSNNSPCVGCAGIGGGDEFPKINNVVSSANTTGANFSWTATDNTQLVTTTFSYGLTPSYGLTGAVTGAAPNFKTALAGLADNTLYHFRITATDNANQTAQFLSTFKTGLPPADTAPPIITNRRVTVGITTTSLAWDTNEPADSQINYGFSTSYGDTVLDNNLVFSRALLLSNLLPNTSYHYRIISADGLGNSVAVADAIFTTLKDAVLPPDVSNLGLVIKPDSFVINWRNPDLAAVPDFKGVKVVRTVGAPAPAATDPAGTVVYNGSGETFTDRQALANINYYYTIFSFDTSFNYSPGAYQNGVILPPPGVEICNNGVEDNGDGLIDCADSQCAAAQSCQIPVSSTPSLAPPPVVVPPTVTYTPPTTTVSELNKLALTDFNFLAGAGKITLTPSAGVVTSLAGAPLLITISGRRLASAPKNLTLVIAGSERHQFQHSLTTDEYRASFSFPGVFRHQAYVEINYDSGQFDSVGVILQALAPGEVTANGARLAGAELTLYQAAETIFPAQNFGQTNPLITKENGTFGWVVPNGQYFLAAKKSGFYERFTPLITVANNVYNNSAALVALPAKPAEVAAAVFKLGVQNISDAIVTLKEKSRDPAVQNTAANIVAPTVVAAVAVSAVAFISWANLLPFLRLLFLQPLLLLGRRQREGWGQVYNALNKLPVDLATLRLINADTGQVAQTKVSDKKGRYAFVASPGNYRIEVVKNNLSFPSQLLSGVMADGRRADIYHGEIIKVTTDEAVITANVPLDPLGEFKKPARIFWARLGRSVQLILSWVGLGVTAVSFYLAPRWYVGALFAAHAGLFLLFRRLALPPKIKSWGIVYDANNKKPVGRVIARLFNSQFNKLVDTQITDPRGRYYFMAGDSQYYVTYENQKYAPHQTETIDLSGKEAENIAVDVQLNPQNSLPDSQK